MLLVGRTVWTYTGRQIWAQCLRPYSSQAFGRTFSSESSLLKHRSLSTSESLLAKRHREFFSSISTLHQPQHETKDGEQQKLEVHDQKRKIKRNVPGKNSLRSAAVEAQRSRAGDELKKSANLGLEPETKTITAICAAEQYDVAQVSHILQTRGHQLDPYGTGLYPQVVHIEVPVELSTTQNGPPASSFGDIFVFPSGTVVAWDVPEEMISSLTSDVLSAAAQNPHPKSIEEEDLEYLVDTHRESSTIRGDTIVLGTGSKSHVPDVVPQTSQPTSKMENRIAQEQGRTVDIVLAKIAFSSGLARSTKLAVLEGLFNNYFQSTKSIPHRLSLGGRLPFSRSFILQKTGELLNIRAQLNLYSELTDSLPDLFWDSPHELGLEAIYDQVGRALDTNIRVKTLNDKMDYAQEIASVLREQLSETHGVRLEWIIILLISVEVGFILWHEYKDYSRNSRQLERQA